jgi:hypothetical protein
MIRSIAKTKGSSGHRAVVEPPIEEITRLTPGGGEDDGFNFATAVETGLTLETL